MLKTILQLIGAIVLLIMVPVIFVFFGAVISVIGPVAGILAAIFIVPIIVGIIIGWTKRGKEDKGQ